MKKIKLEKKNLYIIIHYTILIISILAAFIFGLSFKVANDGFWHIKVGEYIVKNKSIPFHDIFSWYGMSLNLKWISHEWLFGVIIYLIYSIKGFLSIGLFLGIVNSINFILLYIFVNIKSKCKWIALFSANMYIICTLFDLAITPRPFMLSISLVLLVCILLEKKNYIKALLVLIIGINIHGGIYPIYLIIFAYYTFPTRFKYFLASFICILFNPNTYKIYLYTIWSMKELAFERKFIQEWAVTSIYNVKLELIIVIISVFVYSFGKVKLKDMLYSGSFIILALSSYRHLLFLTILVNPLLSPYFNDCINNLIEALNLNDKGISFKNFNIGVLRIKSLIKDLITVALFELPLILIIFSVLVIFLNRIPLFHIDESLCPVHAVDYINEHSEIKYSHLMNTYNDSQYLIFRGIPTFIDSRADLFLKSYNENINVLEDYSNSLKDLRQTEGFIKKYKFDYILVNKSDNLYSIFNNYKNLSSIYQDKNYCIFKVMYYLN